MKKLYRKSTVHPTPSIVSEQLLSFLPTAILTLTAALSPEDREVLAYLISSSPASFSNGHRGSSRKTAAPGGGSKDSEDHPPCFNCSCFRCYMSYWVKWDSSPNRQLIHEVIDAFEDSLLEESKKEKKRRERRKGKSVKAKNISLGVSVEPKSSDLSPTKNDSNFLESNAAADGGGGVEHHSKEEEQTEKGSIRRLVSFLGERIWRSVWG
ncbi:hypothetical protein OROGR_003298 [Orobanche gracilis]